MEIHLPESFNLNQAQILLGNNFYAQYNSSIDIWTVITVVFCKFNEFWDEFGNDSSWIFFVSTRSTILSFEQNILMFGGESTSMAAARLCSALSWELFFSET